MKTGGWGKQTKRGNKETNMAFFGGKGGPCCSSQAFGKTIELQCRCEYSVPWSWQCLVPRFVKSLNAPQYPQRPSVCWKKLHEKPGKSSEMVVETPLLIVNACFFFPQVFAPDMSLLQRIDSCFSCFKQDNWIAMALALFKQNGFGMKPGFEAPWT